MLKSGLDEQHANEPPNLGDPGVVIDAPEQLAEPNLVKAIPIMQRIARGMDIVIVDDKSSSGSDPFASSDGSSDDKEEEQKQAKQQDRLHQLASAMQDDGPAEWTMANDKNLRMPKLDENELRHIQSRYNFQDDKEQVGYLAKKLRLLVRK